MRHYLLKGGRGGARHHLDTLVSVALLSVVKCFSVSLLSSVALIGRYTAARCDHRHRIVILIFMNHEY